MNRRLSYALAAPLLAMTGALGISALVLWAAGNNPFDIFEQMYTHVDGTSNIVTILNKGVPYYVAGVSVALGFKMNLFNIGVDGQYRLAALLAGAAGAAVSLPAPIHVTFIMLVAMAVGAAWAAIPGVLKVTRGVNEVVATIMMNSIATGITAYLLGTYLRDEVVLKRTQIAQTKTLEKSARFPHLDALLPFDLPKGVHLHGFLVIAVILGVVVHLMLTRTTFGLELRTSGVNAPAARSSGVDPNRMIITTIVTSGAIAGLAAMAPLMSERWNYSDTFPLGVGFTGISVALLGQNHPGGIAVAALVWAGVEDGARGITNGPAEITKIMLGTLLLTAVIGFTATKRRAESAAVREAAALAAAAARPTIPSSGQGLAPA